jgi:hypothetical protein
MEFSMKPGIFSSVRKPSIPRIEQRRHQLFVIHANGREEKCHNLVTARFILARSSTEVK